jgi:hypothetical protein
MNVTRIITAAMVAAALAGGLGACGSQAGQSPGGQNTGPSAAYTVAQSIVGSTVTTGAEQGAVVHSDYATGIITTDAAGDASVPVQMVLYSPASDPSGDWQETNARVGAYAGTATLYADGSACTAS